MHCLCVTNDVIRHFKMASDAEPITKDEDYSS